MTTEVRSQTAFEAPEAPVGRFANAYDNASLLQWLIFLRVVVATFTLGTIFIINYPEYRATFYALIGTHVLAALLSALLIQSLAYSKPFLVAQIYWDIGFVTALVILSGGYFSVFSFMYVLSVIYAAIILDRRGTFVSAGISVAAFAGVLVMHLTGTFVANILPTEHAPTPLEVVYKLAINAFAILAAAVLSSFLSERGKALASELHHKQDDLVRLRARFEHIVRSIPIGLLALDDEECVVFANGPTADILRLGAGPLEGRRVRDLIPALGDRPLADFARPAELQIESNDEPVFVELSYSPLGIGGRGLDMRGLVIVEDRTAVRAMETAVKRSERMAALGKLAGGIAHEIRNPLASLSGSIQLLSRELSLDALNRQLMDIVLRETDRVNALVSDFLAFARPGKNNECLVDARIVGNEVVTMLAGEPVCRDGQVKVHALLDERLYVRADPNNLRQVLWNLAVNAVQAMPDGGVLTLRGRVREEPVEGFDADKIVELTVTDTGLGITEDVMSAIFDPFFSTKDNGTGLGLTMCHNIVEMYKGRVLVDSRPERGSRFTVQLPAAPRAGAIRREE
ncbi:hypothetical protein K8I61_19465 [bacterium]|nr:hypothetical protein [bacterium]